MSLPAYFGKDWDEIQRHYGYYLLPVIIIAVGLLILRFLSRQKLNMPPGPMGLPLVGYLPFLGKEPFRVLDRLRKKYGNVYSLYLGRDYVVALGDFAAVKEALTKTSTINRLDHAFGFLKDGAGVSSANGEEWIEQRRSTVRSMKDIGLGGSNWAHLVEEEVAELITQLASKKGDPVDISKFLTSSICNNISSLVFGKRMPSGEERDFLVSAVNTVSSFFSQSGLWNFFPWLYDVLVKMRITNHYKRFCDMEAFNSVIRKEIDSHKKTQSNMKTNDFINSYLDAMQEKEQEGKPTTLNERNLIGNTQGLFIAGSDTTNITLTWLFLAMASYPDIQEKVHSELDYILGTKQRATWEERLKFPYTYAVIMESMRWRTIVPINTARVAMEDIKICGYDIPKGSQITALNWSLHNDTRYWPDPEKFVPERFLLNEGKVVNLKIDSYVPFSHGKRRCPGDIVAMMEIFLYFTAIMQLFKVTEPRGRKTILEGVLGLSFQPVPQELCFLPREDVSETK